VPPSLRRIGKLHQGLVLLAGITGSGKSTTIAAMINEINENRACHIVTVEDPIEYLFEDKKAFINQREIGIDVADFHAALKYLMREDPDVVLVGEMRDRETFEAAMAKTTTILAREVLRPFINAAHPKSRSASHLKSVVLRASLRKDCPIKTARPGKRPTAPMQFA